MIGYLENIELKTKKVEINDVDRLLNKFCAKGERIKNKLHQLIETEDDLSLVYELESLIET